jgi:hypothetical protein
MKRLFPKNRYQNARGNSKKLAELIKEDSELLKAFGVVVDGVDPGVVAHLQQFVETDEHGSTYHPEWGRIILETTTWWWLREILLELKTLREKPCPVTNGNEEK